MRYGRCDGVVQGGRGLGWLASDQDGLGIYTEHSMSTAGVDNETRWISGIQRMRARTQVSRDRGLGKCDG